MAGGGLVASSKPTERRRRSTSRRTSGASRAATSARATLPSRSRRAQIRVASSISEANPAPAAQDPALGRLDDRVGGEEGQWDEGGEQGVPSRGCELGEALAPEERRHLVAAIGVPEELQRHEEMPPGRGENQSRGRMALQPSSLLQGAQGGRPRLSGEPGKPCAEITGGEDRMPAFDHCLENGHPHGEIVGRTSGESMEQRAERRELAHGGERSRRLGRGRRWCFRSGSRSPGLCFVAHQRDSLSRKSVAGRSQSGIERSERRLALAPEKTTAEASQNLNGCGPTLPEKLREDQSFRIFGARQCPERLIERSERRPDGAGPHQTCHPLLLGLHRKDPGDRLTPVRDEEGFPGLHLIQGFPKRRLQLSDPCGLHDPGVYIGRNDASTGIIAPS